MSITKATSVSFWILFIAFAAGRHIQVVSYDFFYKVNQVIRNKTKQNCFCHKLNNNKNNNQTQYNIYVYLNPREPTS